MKPKLFRVIGLMSGTSIDGIDAALVETDGINTVKPLAFTPNPYEREFRTQLRSHLGNRSGRSDPKVAEFERELTELHAGIVETLLTQAGVAPEQVDLIGFHGQTIWHQPDKRETIQIGDGALLAKLTKISVINDFRTADVKAGGHGAPLVPLYHRALAAKLPKPVAILNIGGVSNVSWIGGERDDEILAYDVGPGNAMIDDWVLHHTGNSYDERGLLAAAGRVHAPTVEKVLAMPFFKQKPPKSLDRDAFKNLVPDNLSPADGAATLTMITARAVAAAVPFMPQKPMHLYVTGGGRLNNTLMRMIRDVAGISSVSPVDDLGWSGDGLEAEAFAYLAVRSHLGLPLSVPGTTGVPTPMTGGKLHKPA
ncbi:MAG TPA: anhydro-N-acetylmuramic acid kinase [Alphaproteobacteria bacterium]|nr:anhydro-N-acetylmuramic acid kinase [Alphaproteobacteria bacterium]